MRNWLLPEHLEDILPAEAGRVEALRSSMLGIARAHGYQLVVPPMLEYVESLLTGTGHDLDLVTFKLVDQLSGRHMGIRADITPQVARIDAHLLNRQGVVRLCYAGSVLHALPPGLGHSRESLQLGAELYGHAGVESDIEVQRLMIACLRSARLERLHVDLGHVGIYGALAVYAGLSEGLEADIFGALQGKDRPALRELSASLPAAVREAIMLLPELYGGIEVLAQAASRLPALPEVGAALAQLRQMAALLAGEVDELSFDLAELRGYHYHTGVVFAAYVAGWSDAVARGGRYDHIGRAFGRARPATGFSLVDLRVLAELSPNGGERPAILAPHAEDAALAAEVARLRALGERVIVELPGSQAHRGELGCDRQLVRSGDRWTVKPV